MAEMLQRMATKEIFTVSESRQKYAGKWFRYVIIEDDASKPPSEPDTLKIMVVYVADSKKELLNVCDEEFLDAGFTHFGITLGAEVDPEPGMQMGGTRQ
jgi:hypothetical protein